MIIHLGFCVHFEFIRCVNINIIPSHEGKKIKQVGTSSKKDPVGEFDHLMKSRRRKFISPE
jgi:hypothetical protein